MDKKRLLVLMAAWLPVTALAEVTAVTLYPGQATVTREEQASVQAGEGVIEILNLPAGLMDRSLRVTVSGASGTVIRDVNLATVQTTEAQAQKLTDLRAALQTVEDDIQAHDDTIRAWRYRLELLDRYTQGNGEITLPDNVGTVADSLFDQASKSLSSIRTIEREKRDLVAEQDRLQRELAAINQSPRQVKNLAIGYSAGQTGDVTVQLRYQTRNAGWSSAYEARLDTAGNELGLVHQAVVYQNTGEDWGNVNLSLSTANPDVGGRLPDPSPWIISPQPRPEPVLGKALEMDGVAMAPAPRMMQDESRAAPAQMATLETTGLTQSYRIPGQVSLVDGTRDKRLSVADYQLPAKVSRHLVPALSSLGYVFGEATYEGDATLPAARVTLYQDDQFVGQSWLEQIEPGEALAMSFGVDDKVTVQTVRESDQRGERGLISGQPYLERVTRYDVTNAHSIPIDLRVMERLPVSHHDDIKVTYQDITTPYQDSVDDKPGIIAWDRVVAPGRTVTFRAGFEVRVPEGQDLPYIP
ncbi:mucoidy inhibitor MuiA family protein [Marinobacter zhejiangensis]|uniref:Mucoidy inhibitor MuiA family protein n=1 Tax=Marinobacter zhejiangensis TaxID=488535 RepID=A0A1I4MAM9_9GAMM|nr:mucoidy inhibitor MuiA family protein [Marinobacter zhejiangensis]SFM00095.1 conserved hypothetical protein [Marinobacter zhejiangensis]